MVNSIDFDIQIENIDSNFEEWRFNKLNEAASKSNITKNLQWKASLIDNLKGMLNQFSQYVITQTSKDVPFLQQNQIFIKNTKKYPVKADNAIQNAPNYTNAVQRLSTPLSTHLQGTDLNRIEEETDDNPRVNIQFKKAMVPSFNGQQAFKEFAKQYFYGAEANKQNLNAMQTAVLMQTAYQFCFTYQSRIKSLQTDLVGIINFINKDPYGMPNQQDANAELNTQQNAENSPAAQTMASTNPNANANNAVNASTDYEAFMNDYFGSDWETLVEEKNPTGYKPVQTKSMNPTSPKPTDVTTNKDIQDMAKADKQPSGVPVNNVALLQKKKEIACKIVRDAFAVKLSAIGMVYHDFIFLIRRHVASYRGAEAGNQGNEMVQRPTAKTQLNNTQGGQ